MLVEQILSRIKEVDSVINNINGVIKNLQGALEQQSANFNHEVGRKSELQHWLDKVSKPSDSPVQIETNHEDAIVTDEIPVHEHTEDCTSCDSLPVNDEVMSSGDAA